MLLWHRIHININNISLFEFLTLLNNDSFSKIQLHWFVIVLLYFVLLEICSIDMKSNSVYLMLPIVFFLTWGIAVGIDFLRKEPGFHWLAYFIE